MNSFTEGAQINLHLTEAQLTDYLVGVELSPDAQQHITYCSVCREELGTFGATVDSFNQISDAWSHSAWDQARMGTLLQKSAGVRSSRPLWNAAAWALATCTLLVSAGSMLRHRQNEATRPAVVASAGASQDESEAQIKQDNTLLMEVDRELRTEVSSPVLFEIDAPEHLRIKPHGQTRIQ